MNQSLNRSIFLQIRTLLHRIEDYILIGLLLGIIAMAVTQIFMRNLFDAGIVWGEVLLRTMVLWIGLVGAMVASRYDNHIRIDLVTRYLPKRMKSVVMCIISLFTSFICGLFAYHSLQFVKMELADGGMAFAQVPVWVCAAIIPFASSVIALRYFILALINFMESVNPTS